MLSVGLEAEIQKTIPRFVQKLKELDSHKKDWSLKYLEFEYTMQLKAKEHIACDCLCEICRQGGFTELEGRLVVSQASFEGNEEANC